MSKQFTTIEKIENYLLIDIDASFEAQIESWIETMSQYIEDETGRIFLAGTGTATMKYEVVQGATDDIGNYTGSVVNLQIDDCLSVDSLIIDDEEVGSDNYLLYPANSTPKTRIKLTKDSGLVFTEGEQNIEVTGVWGYAVDTPSDIEFACTVLVAGIINNSWASDGEVKSVAMGSYNLTFKDQKGLQDLEQVKEILAGYQKIDV